MKRISAAILALCLSMSMNLVWASAAEPMYHTGSPVLSIESEPVALSIGGDGITKGVGFLHNAAYITESQLEQLYQNNSGELTYRLGLGDCFTDSLHYSAFEHHSAPDWIYRTLYGLDVETMAKALGVDTSKAISVSVSSPDGTSKSLPDAFGIETKRYCYELDGSAGRQVTPILTMYAKRTVSSQTPGTADLSWPGSPQIGVSSADRTTLTFGYGQTERDEITNCFWVKDVHKLRIGSENTAIKATGRNGKVRTAAVSTIIGYGVTEQTLTYGSDSYYAQGIRLDTLLQKMGIAAQRGDTVTAVTQQGNTVSFPYLDTNGWMAVWNGTCNGNTINNQTSLLLLGPDRQVFDLTELKIEAGSGSGDTESTERPYQKLRLAVNRMISTTAKS